MARLDALPAIVAEMVRPAEKIDSIRIHQVTGMGGPGGGGEGDGKPPVNQALDSIMGMAVQLPALRKLGEELGRVDGGRGDGRPERRGLHGPPRPARGGAAAGCRVAPPHP